MREWCGRAAKASAAAYPRHFQMNVVPALKIVPGFIGAQSSKRRLGETIECLVLTRWQSIDAIRAFASSDINKAVIEPEAVAPPIDLDKTVQHYEVDESV